MTSFAGITLDDILGARYPMPCKNNKCKYEHHIEYGIKYHKGTFYIQIVDAQEDEERITLSILSRLYRSEAQIATARNRRMAILKSRAPEEVDSDTQLAASRQKADALAKLHAAENDLVFLEEECKIDVKKLLASVRSSQVFVRIIHTKYEEHYGK